MARRSKRTTRRVVRTQRFRKNRRQRTVRAFDALRTAQDILDHNRTIVVYDDKIGVVYADGTEMVHSAAESHRVIKEFHEMFDIAKKCTLMCDPLRKKLQELLFICQPIGLTHARLHEHGH